MTSISRKQQDLVERSRYRRPDNRTNLIGSRSSGTGTILP